MKKERFTILFALVALFVLFPAQSMAQNAAPIADAGSSRYAAQDPVVLDGTGSYDPDNSGPLSYTWRQIDGPSVIIIDANTATPTIGGSMQPGIGRDRTLKPVGFTQTDGIQICEFELEVSDGELTSISDAVIVVIVPNFGATSLRLENPSFDPNKPTIIFFGGGNCVTGGGPWGNTAWAEKANMISYQNYGPDPSVGGLRTYYRYGDMIIVYLSSVSPDYKLPIQTMGLSTGGQPAIDVGLRLNMMYQDARYAVNRVSFHDATGYCREYSESISTFLTSSVDGEQCWIDNYVCTLEETHPSDVQYPGFHLNVLNVGFETSKDISLPWLEAHTLGVYWYGNSLTTSEMNHFNNGVVAGAYWSVAGPGKNLQLASTPGEQTYKFNWYGESDSGYMDFWDELNHPGRLPEPVTLVGPEDGAFVDANGAVFSCEESENAVGYQLLFGPDPYRVMDYYIISDTPNPPTEFVTASPFEQTCWTVKVYDQYGSTIYADPIRVNFEKLAPPLIENITTGQRYASVQRAIDEARNGHEIVVSPGVYKGNINFRGKNLTLKSTNPDDSTIVAATVIKGYANKNVVSFSGGEDANSVLAGFTITGGKRGIHCFGSSPTITNCIIARNTNADVGGVGAGIGIEGGSNPTLTNCTIINNSASTAGGGMISQDSSPTLTNCTFSGNSAGYFGSGICFDGGSPMLTNCILWGDTTDEIFMFSGTPVITYSDVQGGCAGEGNIDADPFFADPDNGDYHLKSQAGRWDPDSQSWVIDDVTSPCIDAGDPSIPVGLEPLPNGGIINIGVYGGTVEASKSPAK